MRGLTSLFGMGRGEHPRHNHHKIFMDAERQMLCAKRLPALVHAAFLALSLAFALIIYILGVVYGYIKIKLKLTGN